MKPARSITIISRRTDGLIFPLPFPRVFDIMAKVFQYFTNGEIPMKKKALLAMLLVMTLLLSSCALIKKDAAVDAATVILKLGDKEYTKAQVQTYVDDVLYQMYQSTYNTYGTELDITNASVIASAQETAIKNLKQDMTIRAKAAELGLDQLTEEDLAEAKKDADDSYEYAKTYVKLYMLSEDERNLEGEELDAAVQKGLDALGVSYESYEKAARDTLVDKKVKEYAVKDVTVSEDEIKAEYDAKVAADEEKYKENPSSWVSASNSTSATTLYYTPAGIRRVKQILLKYKADDQTAIDEAQSKVTEINKKISDAQKILDNADASEEEKATAQADLDAANTDLEAAKKALEEARNTGFANLDEDADAILAALAENPDSWDKLMEEKNEDTGLQAGAPNAEKGYAICEGLASFDSAFVDAAMALKSVGDVSGKVKGEAYGYYIIKYVSDEAEGPADYESVKETVKSGVLSTKQDTVYTEVLEQWIKDAGIKEDLGALKN